MNKTKQIGLDFVVDKLTNSIENVVTGDSFPTDITLITNSDVNTIIKKKIWVFDWLHSHANFLFNVVTKAMCHLFQKLNLFNII